MQESKLKILYYLYHAGPAFAAKLASRLNQELQTLKGHIRTLQDEGYVERVQGTIVDYRPEKGQRVRKHRNHTYYQLTRKGKRMMRNFQGRIEVNLRPPYMQA